MSLGHGARYVNNVRTLDIHERAQLDLCGIVKLPVHRGCPKYKVEQRALVDLLDLGLRPVVSRLEQGLRDVLSDNRGEPSAQPYCTEAGWSCAKHGG